MRKLRRKAPDEAELNITSFMNLMIVLVPVLLLSMVFSHITVLDIKLPKSNDENQPLDLENEQLELIIRTDSLQLNFPAGVALKSFSRKDGEHDFKSLVGYLQSLKQSLLQKNIEKRDIVLLSEGDTDYQTIIRAMDSVRSYKAVVAASVVDAELFPDVSLGDAPESMHARRAQVTAPGSDMQLAERTGVSVQ